MGLNLDQIKNLLNKINEEAFGGSLNLQGIEVSFSNKKNMVASAQILLRKVDGVRVPVKVTKIQLSKKFDIQEHHLRDLLAHELIHVYEVQVLKQIPAHGEDFKQKMEEINQKFGYNIVIKEAGFPRAKKTTQEKAICLISEDLSKLVVTKKAFAMKIMVNSAFKERFGDYSVQEVPVDLVIRFSFSRKYTKYYEMNQEKLQKYGII